MSSYSYQCVIRAVLLVLCFTLGTGVSNSAPGEGPAQEDAALEKAIDGAMKLLEQAERALAQGDHDRAVQLARRVITQFPEGNGPIFGAHFIIARVLRAKGDRDAYKAQLQSMVERFRGTPMEHVALNHLAHYYRTAGNVSQAIAALRRATEQLPTKQYPHNYTGLADCYSSLGRWEAVTLTLEQAVGLAEAAPAADAAAWRIARGVGRWDQRLQDAQRSALQSDPIERMLGYLVLLQAGKHERAYAYLTNALRTELTLEQFQEQRATWGLPEGEFQEAQGPRVETRQERWMVTSVRLRLAGEPSKATRQARFEWVHEPDGIWRLQKVTWLPAPKGEEGTATTPQ